MKLTSFQILNFRSVNDSGSIRVGNTTCLVGRNESGKSNLLLALQTLNPPGGRKDLSAIKDFPRQRRLNECTDETTVVSTTWSLDEEEQRELTAIFPRAAGVAHVEVGRSYKAQPLIFEFVDLKPLHLSAEEVTASLRKIRAAVEVGAEKLEPTAQQGPITAFDQLMTALTSSSEPRTWAAAAAAALAAFRKILLTATITLPEREEGQLSALEDLAAQIGKDAPSSQAARDWISKRLPLFVYVDDYPELTGHQNIADYLNRKANPSQLTPADLNFEKMCKVAGLDPQQLHTLHGSNEHETRNQLANRASAIVTSELRRLWKDRELKVRFGLDANHLDTFISDPNSVYDVEVNLDERSRGLKWFFSFYITFAADTKGGAADNAILLLDEPGLYLHALSQADLLSHLSADFGNQIIFTTHSPFMVPTDDLDAIRTVNIGQDAGTTVTNDPTGDSRTLFPIQAALGFKLSQSLFVGPDNLLVEGVTDFWILSSISAYLDSQGRTALPKDVILTPAGGAQKIPYMVALLTSEKLRVMVLFDEEKQSRATKDELLKAKLIRDENVIFVTDGFLNTNIPAEADIEDLLDPALYDSLVAESYAKELSGKKIMLNAKIPRIVKRYETAFGELGIEFHKTRPARLLLNKMASDATKVMNATTLDNFDRLFSKIGQLFAKNASRHLAPFR